VKRSSTWLPREKLRIVPWSSRRVHNHPWWKREISWDANGCADMFMWRMEICRVAIAALGFWKAGGIESYFRVVLQNVGQCLWSDGGDLVFGVTSVFIINIGNVGLRNDREDKDSFE
jgi:hypothetical protein